MMVDPQPRRWAVDTKNGLTGSLSWSNTGTQLTSFTGAKRNKCTLVVLVLVLEGMKKRTRATGRAGGLCRRKGKGEHCVGGGRGLVLVVLVLKSKDRRW